MDEVLPIIGFVFYVIFQIYKASLKAKEKQNKKQQKQPTVITIPHEDNKKTVGPPPLPTFRKKRQEPTPREKQYPQVQSLEITEAPYSNLEENILDDVHKSKIPHHKLGEIKAMKPEKRKLPSLRKFNARQAFIQSLIFNRKHFKI